ncbi:hypothetical protein E5288_WYG003330 [Bos mutus]|uniref:Protein ripply2 n=1 Tax=Bos mutus TaxID=72004 RepID=A0A6B0REZ3_9CETA|nr:hypothetical protein [Bos mutus]
MDVANRFYKYLLSRKIVSTTSGIPQYDTDEDTAIFKMWVAHQAAIDVAKLKFSDVSSLNPIVNFCPPAYCTVHHLLQFKELFLNINVGSYSRSAVFWRPWIDDGGEKEQEAPHNAVEAMPDGPGITDASGKLSQYRHPVRLFWPKSKCYDYLYQEAEALLKNFPIQATISFYEDSDSEDETEELICEN